MKRTALLLAFAICAAFAAGSATSAAFRAERLRYSINWPSGLSLGESQLRASGVKATPERPERMEFEFTLQAGVPGFQVLDHYRATAAGEFCSIEFNKDLLHGRKKAEEKTVFDAQAGTATRETTGGGKTELKASSCGRDALTFLYFLRHELSQGRIPPPQTVFFGAPYDVRFEFAGTQTIHLGENAVEADRITASAKGPSSDIAFEIFFLKDANRTPALVRVPLPLGVFSMELVR
jgi:hypothetical protein